MIAHYCEQTLWKRPHNLGEIEKRKRRHFGRTGNIKKVQNHKYHVSEERWTYKSPNGATKTEID